MAVAILPPAELRIEHAAARVAVIPEQRSDIAVAVTQGAGFPPVRVSRNGSAIVVDGGLAQAGRTGPFDWFDHGRCRADPKTLPTIIARVPRDARIAGSGALTGTVQPSGSLALTLAGCGDWRVGAVSGPLDLTTASRGRVLLAKVDGRLSVRIAGKGGVTIAGGHAPNARIEVAASGGLVDQGSAGQLKAVVNGSGKVRVAEVWGLVDADVNGSGDVFYGRPRGVHFCGTYQAAC